MCVIIFFFKKKKDLPIVSHAKVASQKRTFPDSDDDAIT